MQLYPETSLGLINGWILLVLFYAVLMIGIGAIWSHDQVLAEQAACRD